MWRRVWRKDKCDFHGSDPLVETWLQSSHAGRIPLTQYMPGPLSATLSMMRHGEMFHDGCSPIAFRCDTLYKAKVLSKLCSGGKYTQYVCVTTTRA